MLSPGLQQVLFGSRSTPSATVTVAPGVVAADLTAYQLMIRLSGAPANFWTGVRTDGADIRAYTSDGVTQIPMDLVWFNWWSQDGLLVVKTDLTAAGGGAVKIKWATGDTTLPANNSPYGRNAVWTAYDAVFPLARSFEDHTGGSTLVNYGSGQSIVYGSDLFDINAHQGAKWDGAYWNIIDTAALKKFDSAGSLLLTVAATAMFAAAKALLGYSSALTHIGDGAIIQDKFYLPCETIGANPPGTTATQQCIIVVDLTTYAFITAYDVSATFGTKEFGALGYDPTTNTLAGAGFGSSSSFELFDVTGVHQSTVTVTNPTSQTLQQWQSMLWVDGAWLISQNDGRIIRVTPAGAFVGSVYFTSTADSYEGLTLYDDKIGRVKDSRDLGGISRVQLFDRISFEGGAGMTFAPNTGLKATGRASRTTFTMSGWFSITALSTQQSVFSYVNAAALPSANRRATIYGARTSASPVAEGGWDGVSAWIQASSPANPSLNTAYQITMVRTGTTRRFYINGQQVNSQTGLSAVYGDLDTLFLAYEDDDGAERITGNVAFCTLAPTDLGSAWIAADYANLNDPASFYTFT